MTNILTTQGASEFKARINNLSANSSPEWGKMNVAQMLAHCSVAYEMAFENKHTKPGGFKVFLLKAFLKNIVVGPKPYKRNSGTAPEFKITEPKDFETEKGRILSYLDQTVALGEDHFEGRMSHSFGSLTKEEWNVMFAKHLDHHLSQFGV